MKEECKKLMSILYSSKKARISASKLKGNIQVGTEKTNKEIASRPATNQVRKQAIS